MTGFYHKTKTQYSTLCITSATIPRPIISQLFKYQPHKIGKHTQTICRLLPTNCLIVFDHFVVLVLKGLGSKFAQLHYKQPKALLTLCFIMLKMAKHTLKFMKCSHHIVFKVGLARVNVVTYLMFAVRKKYKGNVF